MINQSHPLLTRRVGERKVQMNNTGTREWAKYSANILNGCSHDCLYCYAHTMSARFEREPQGGWKNEALKPGIFSKSVGKKSGRVMFPTAHDITPRFLPEAVRYIESQLSVGNELLIVSKPHFDCISEICQQFAGQKDQIMFRFSIGSVDDSILTFWEPGAPHFDERLECLKLAYTAGFATSVSVEPMLEGDIDRLVRTVYPFVTDSIWLGKINRLICNLTFNGYNQPDIIARARKLVALQDDESIKRLYDIHKSNPKVKFKESIKRIVGLPISTTPGSDS
jgi:DNA repair photolyase